MKKVKIGFIGIGLMGYPMAKNLLKSKYQIKVFNRTKNKALKLKKFGAEVCNSLKEVVSDRDLIITMLSDDKAIKKIYFNSEFLKNLKKGSTVIDMSSANPRTAINLSKLLKKYKINFLDAPVSGGTNGAENAELAIMVGGDKKVFSKNLNVLKKLGNPVLVGKNSAGQIAKLANQIIVGITIGSVQKQ
jgi:3-hydroxyisobutyrate dehydrogenase and related beta-hydroxyacid dehydrogenases